MVNEESPVQQGFIYLSAFHGGLGGKLGPRNHRLGITCPDQCLSVTLTDLPSPVHQLILEKRGTYPNIGSNSAFNV